MEDQIDESEELHKEVKIVVDFGQSPLRIDKFLMDRLPDVSRSKIQEATKTGLITVDENEIKPNFKVKPGHIVKVIITQPKQEIQLIPENIPLNIVFEDEDLVVINKPYEMVVHPGYGNHSGTLVNALVYHFKGIAHKGDSARPGLVHRLDKNTSGLLVIGKTEFALNHLAKQFFDRTTKRSYLALVWGDVEEEAGSIEGHIGRSLKNRKVMSVFPDGEYGKYAKTNYKVVERFGYVTLIECKLETGRTHQIRAHMKYIGHPIFGDIEYGGNQILKGTSFTKYKQFVNNCFQLIPSQALHAKSLGFIHPTKNKEMFFESELPDGYKKILEKWTTYTTTRDMQE